MTNTNEKIGIIVDSFSGWDREEANKHGAFFVPLRITLNGEELLDGVDLSAVKMIEKMRNIEDAKSSAPTPGDFKIVYEKAFKKGYTKIIVLPCTRGFSITPVVAQQAAEEYNGKVIVCSENILTSTATQDAVINAVSQIKKGTTVEKLMAYFKAVNDSQILLVIPKDLHALKRGGRIPKSLGTVMNWLRVVPVIKYDGQNHKLKIMRTQTKAVDWSVKWAKEQIGTLKGYTCSLLCMQAKPLTLFVKNTKEKLESSLVNAKVKVNRVSALIAIHTGVGAIGILMYNTNAK